MAVFTVNYWSCGHVAVQFPEVAPNLLDGPQCDVGAQSQFRAFRGPQGIDFGGVQNLEPLKNPNILKNFWGDAWLMTTPAQDNLLAAFDDLRNAYVDPPNFNNMKEFFKDAKKYLTLRSVVAKLEKIIDGGEDDKSQAESVLQQVLKKMGSLNGDEEFPSLKPLLEELNEINKPSYNEMEKKIQAENTLQQFLKKDALEKAKKFPYLKPLLHKLNEINDSSIDEEEKKKQAGDALNKFMKEDLEEKKGLGINLEGDAIKHTRYGKMPIKKWSIPYVNSAIGDQAEKNLDEFHFFGLSPTGIQAGFNALEASESEVHRNLGYIYYKTASRYHNCAGYPRYILEHGGITSFGSTSALELAGVTIPGRYVGFMDRVEKNISKLNKLTQDLIRSAKVELKALSKSDLETNFLKKYFEDFDKVPLRLSNLIALYNKQRTDVSYEYKINLLSDIIREASKYREIPKKFVDALQKEIRRNNAIPFNSAYSPNYYFQLNFLIKEAALQLAVAIVALVAYVCPPLLKTTMKLTSFLASQDAVTSSYIVSNSMFNPFQHDVHKPSKPEEKAEEGSRSAAESEGKVGEVSRSPAESEEKSGEGSISPTSKQG